MTPPQTTDEDARGSDSFASMLEAFADDLEGPNWRHMARALRAGADALKLSNLECQEQPDSDIPAAPPTDEDREALANILDRSDPEGGVWRDDLEGKPDLWFWHPQVDAILAWMERAGFRRSAVSTPDPEATITDEPLASLLDDAQWQWTNARNGQTFGQTFGEFTAQFLAARVRRSAVSAPPTITDDQIAVLAKYATELVKYVEADNLPFDAFHWAKSALVAALGGEATTHESGGSE